jgi:hypothetical protein
MGVFSIKNIIGILYSLGIVGITYFIHNPIFAGCVEEGVCTSGYGFPLPYYFTRYCTSGSLHCTDNLFTPISLFIDIIVVTVIVLIIRAFTAQDAEESSMYTTR